MEPPGLIATRLRSALLILVTASCRTLAARPVSLDDQRSRLQRVLHEGRCREDPAECQRAIADLERSLATNPHADTAARVHLEVADAWGQLGARDRALAHVRAVIARPQYRFEGLLKMARLYFAAAEEKQAWKALHEAAALEAEGAGGRRRTAAQQADRAHVHFASLVVEPIARARTDPDREQALRTAEGHLDDHTNDAATTPILIGMARGWFALGKLDRALALLERAAARPDESRGVALVGLAEVQERLGRPHLAMSALRTAANVDPVDTATSVMDADNTKNVAHRRLGRILELRREWRDALAVYERWHPSSWCGNEAASYENQREAGIARARLRLGDASDVLTAYEKKLPEWPPDFIGPAPLLRFVELAALAHDLPRAEAAVRAAFRSGQDRRSVEEERRAVHLIEALRQPSGRTLLDVVRSRLQSAPFDGEPEEAAIVGRLLATFAPSAVRALPQLIRAGDKAAIAVAGHVPDLGCRQALADRLRVETEPAAKASIERAVFELSYLTVEAE